VCMSKGERGFLPTIFFFLFFVFLVGVLVSPQSLSVSLSRTQIPLSFLYPFYIKTDICTAFERVWPFWSGSVIERPSVSLGGLVLFFLVLGAGAGAGLFCCRCLCFVRCCCCCRCGGN
jgi:hypothetical protein